MEQGCSSLPVDEQARVVLRAWMRGEKRCNVPPPLVPQAESKNSAAELYEALESETPEPEVDDDEEEQVFFRPGGRTPEEAWEFAQNLLLRWEPLKLLNTLRSTPVWGEGSRQADIMFVGDAPNHYDEQAGRPFCGEAGGKLDGMLKAMGLTRQEVYITHFVKFRPMVPRQTYNNRPPSKDEIRLSAPVVKFEVEQVQPKVIVALGVIAARGLLQQGELPLAAYQQLQNASFCGVPVVVTHHPSYLLRTAVLEERRRLWEEMLRVMEMAALPISAKQRGYFLPKQ